MHPKISNKLIETIGRFDTELSEWISAGTLSARVTVILILTSHLVATLFLVKRRLHGAIIINGSVLVVGGLNDNPTEKCLLGDRVNCSEQEPILTNYYSYPELFLVQQTYCSEML